MSLVLIKGFDLYPAISGDAGMNTVWTFNSTSSMWLDPGRFGGQAIRSSQDRSITSPIFTLTASVSVGFAFKAAGYPGGAEEIEKIAFLNSSKRTGSKPSITSVPPQALKVLANRLATKPPR